MGQEKMLEEILHYIENELNILYKTILVHNQPNYVSENGTLFMVNFFPNNDPSFFIEYANNEDEAKIWHYEDGDRFYLSDYPTKEELYSKLLEEIKIETEKPQ